MKRAFWKLRIFTKRTIQALHLAGVFTLVEWCRDCGRKQPLVWTAPDPLWDLIYGGPGGVLCPSCFDDRCVRAGLFITWRPSVWHVGSGIFGPARPRSVREDHLLDMARGIPLPGCYACQRTTSGCWEHSHCVDCRIAGPNRMCPRHDSERSGLPDAHTGEAPW